MSRDRVSIEGIDPEDVEWLRLDIGVFTLHRNPRIAANDHDLGPPIQQIAEVPDRVAGQLDDGWIHFIETEVIARPTPRGHCPNAETDDSNAQGGIPVQRPSWMVHHYQAYPTIDVIVGSR